MDRTETYIKMSDCPEIQEGNTLVYGDLYTMRRGETGFTHTDDECIGGYLKHHLWEDQVPITNPYFLWLPYQHQLQAMLVGKWLTVEVFGRFLRWFGEKEPMMRTAAGGANPFITGEQLWLAFVMKEKHGKTWDGQGWICID